MLQRSACGEDPCSPACFLATNVADQNQLVGWLAAIGPNASVTFGFIGSWTGSNTAPAPTCTAS